MEGVITENQEFFTCLWCEGNYPLTDLSDIADSVCLECAEKNRYDDLGGHISCICTWDCDC